jgi:two-component system LytT family response regulator
VTAYDRYALKAFEAEALDYLLKPYDNARFFRVLARAKALLARRPAERRRFERIMVRSAGRISFLRVEEIDWIEAADYYSCLHVGARTHLLRRSMAELERDLETERFCRIHRSTIVNLTRVRDLCLDSSGEYEVVLRDETRLKVSRGYREKLQAAIQPRP